MTATAPTPSVHATCVVLAGAGVLIRGPSGSGKSTLARALLVAGEELGLRSRLVGDDRIRLSAEGGRLVARPHPAIAGLMEVRGVGIVPVPHQPACDVRLVVDLIAIDSAAASDSADTTDLLAIRLPRIWAEPGEAVAAVLRRLRDRDDTRMTER